MTLKRPSNGFGGYNNGENRLYVSFDRTDEKYRETYESYYGLPPYTRIVCTCGNCGSGSSMVDNISLSDAAPKPWLVYQNKSNDVWIRDAYQWMEDNGHKEEDFEGIISETIFYMWSEEGKFHGRPVVFVSKILTDH